MYLKSKGFAYFMFSVSPYLLSRSLQFYAVDMSEILKKKKIIIAKIEVGFDLKLKTISVEFVNHESIQFFFFFFIVDLR